MIGERVIFLKRYQPGDRQIFDRRYSVVVAVAVGLLLCGAVLSVTHREVIDLETARVRREMCLAGFCWLRSTTDTLLTEMAVSERTHLDRPLRVVRETSLWRPVSPHFVHHGSVATIHQLRTAFEAGGLGRNQREVVMRRVLGSLRNDDVREAERIVDETWQARRRNGS